MFAVEEDWLDDNTKVMCRVCNNVMKVIFSLTPADDEEYTKLEKRLGDISNWRICKNCIKKIEHEINCDVILKDAETVTNYEFEHYEKEDLKKVGGAIIKINDRSILCPKCDKEMNINFSKAKSQNLVNCSTKYEIKISCRKCSFIYSDERVFSICGSIIDCNKELIMLEPTASPPYLKDVVDKSVMDMIKRNQGVKGVVYPHNNFDFNALKIIQDIGELLEFLIIDGKIVRILTGDE